MIRPPKARLLEVPINYKLSGKARLITIILIFSSILLWSCEKAAPPVGWKKPDIKNLEYEKYATYENKELARYDYIVYKINKSNGTLEVYNDGYDLHGNLTNRQVKLKDFVNRYIFDLESFKLLKVVEDWSNIDFSNNLHGKFYTELNFDYTNLRLDSKFQSWDGYNITTEKSRQTISKDYNYIFEDSIFPEMRMVDFTKPGRIYGALPSFFKDPLIGYIWAERGEKKIETAAGKFSVSKLNYRIGDKFLTRLLQNITEGVAIYVDASKSNIGVIRMVYPGSIQELAETGIWTDR